MNAASPGVSHVAPADEMRNLHQYWRWFLALGIGMVALGMFVIGWACIATLTIAATWFFGFVLLASGISEIVNSFWAGRWSGMLLHLLIGVLYVVVGFIIIDQPVDAAMGLTLMIALFLMVGGIFRMVFAVSERFSGWGWVLLNGAVSLMLGMLIYKQWPASGLWVIGTFLGIDLILNGWSWVMLALGARKAVPAVPAEPVAAAAPLAGV
ncbi:MAG: HdeD family acid-resistance protein [Bryobacteraceae bacterium]|nr:HdeD family acid-resistance protein [Bryobacteraceae bacterium]